MSQGDRRKILLASVGSFGDVFPFMALGKAFQERGYEVTLLTSGYFQDRVEAAGMKVAPVGSAEQYKDYISNPNLNHPYLGFLLTRDILGSILKPIYEYLREEWQFPGATIVASPYCMSARIARETMNFKLVTVNLAPISMGSILSPPVVFNSASRRNVPRFMQPFYGRMVHSVTDRVIGKPVNDFRKTLGLQPIRRLMQWWHSPDGCVSLFADWFAAQSKDWPTKHAFAGFLNASPSHHELEPEVEQFLAAPATNPHASAGPLLFYPGSNTGHLQNYARVCRETCELLQCNGLLVAPGTPDWKSLGSQRLGVSSYVSMKSVLSRVKAFIHHGGIGSVNDCFRAGIPQIIRPMVSDQPDNAARVAQLGVGVALTPGRFNAKNIANALRRLRTESTLEKCREIQGRMAVSDGLAEAVHLIEERVGSSLSAAMR